MTEAGGVVAMPPAFFITKKIKIHGQIHLRRQA